MLANTEMSFCVVRQRNMIANYNYDKHIRKVGNGLAKPSKLRPKRVKGILRLSHQRTIYPQRCTRGL
jgi:hypothetical protein